VTIVAGKETSVTLHKGGIFHEILNSFYRWQSLPK